MENIYEELGFKRPEILENPYGIKIYIGTKNKDDWCVEIPKEVCRIKCKAFDYGKNLMYYLVSESCAIGIAREYTELAKSLKG